MAVSLKGCTSSCQEENRVLVFLGLLLHPAEGRQFTLAELLTQVYLLDIHQFDLDGFHFDNEHFYNV